MTLSRFFQVGGITTAILFSLQSNAQIQDNSFLIEEAYNQDSRVVQHISVGEYANAEKNFDYNFTQEWSLFTQKHQVSYTVPLSFGGSSMVFENFAIHYRIQLANNGKIAFAPRISTLLSPGWGLQFNLPVSIGFSEKTSVHYNMGMSFFPENRTRTRNKTTEIILGSSFIWHVRANFNFLAEFVFTDARTEIVSENNVRKITVEKELIINPGFRAALNLKSGLQIVPGLAVPLSVTDTRVFNALLFYLSFEHGYE